MTRRERIDELHAVLQGVVGTHDFSGNTAKILDLTPEMCPEWKAGMVIAAKSVVSYNGVKYYCPNGATAQAHFLPDGIGLEAVYKPYTDASLKNWIYNEYVEAGWQRIDPNGKTYEVYNCTVLLNNLWQPSQLAANWRVVNG